MKKVIFIVLMTILSAATSLAQITVSAGYGLASHTVKAKIGNTIEKTDPTNLNGIYLGASYEFSILSKSWGDLSLNPGLTYSFYGKCLHKESSSESGVKTLSKESRRDHYLDLPVHAKYSYNLIPGKLKLSAYAGPVFSFGLAAKMIDKVVAGDNWSTSKSGLYSGNYKLKGVYGGEKLSENTKGNGTEYSLFDLKMALGISANLFETVDVCIAYNFGLLDRYTDKSSDMNIKSHTNIFQVGLAYRF